MLVTSHIYNMPIELWLKEHREPLLIGHDANGDPVEVYINPTGHTQGEGIPLLVLSGKNSPRQHMTFVASYHQFTELVGWLSLALSLKLQDDEACPCD